MRAQNIRTRKIQDAGMTGKEDSDIRHARALELTLYPHYTHTYSNAHAGAHTHTFTRMHAHTHAHIHTCIHACTHLYMLTNTLAAPYIYRTRRTSTHICTGWEREHAR